MKFIINTLTSWDEPPRARHQVTNELLTKGHEVIFVEKNRSGPPKLSTRNIDQHFTLVTPYFFPGYKIRYRLIVLNEIYQLWLFRQLRTLYGDTLIINFDFTSHLLKRIFNRSIYYCNDEHIGNSYYSNFLVNLYHKNCEISVVKNSLLCITTSSYLTQKLNEYNEKVYEIPLGGPDPAILPDNKRISDNPKIIVVGLMGFISLRKYSYKLINRLLKEKKFRIVFIGPVEKSFLMKIDEPDRIEIKGGLKGKSLYSAIQEFDVAIAPYKLQSINPGTTSNKLYQCIACGVPVVISSIPNLEQEEFPDGVAYFVDNDDDFITVIKQVVKTDKETIKKNCKEFARKNSWSIRVNQFISILINNNIIE